MEILALLFIELFGDWFSKTMFRVFLGAAVFFLPFLLVSIYLWNSDSNLWIFASTIASKVAAAAVLIVGLVMAFCMLAVLAENNSWNQLLGDGDLPK